MKRKTLMAYSSSYFQQNDMYEIFSQAEDFPGKIFEYLKKIVNKKDVMDMGCGTGKYINLLSPYVKSITGVDASSDQIRLAKEKNRSKNNVKLLVADASKVKLTKDSFDVIMGCRFLPTVINRAKQGRIIRKMQNALKPGGQIFLIENSTSGEFETIREKQKLNPNPTVQYNNRLIDQGFIPIKKIKTHFLFRSMEEAKDVFTAIRGAKKGNNVKSKKIGHDVTIFQYKKKTL